MITLEYTITPEERSLVVTHPDGSVSKHSSKTKVFNRLCRDAFKGTRGKVNKFKVVIEYE